MRDLLGGAKRFGVRVTERSAVTALASDAEVTAGLMDALGAGEVKAATALRFVAAVQKCSTER